MSRYQQLGNLLTGMMGQHPSRVAAFLDTLDDASAARLMEAAEAGDTRPILKAMSEQTWGTAPGRPAPMPQEPTGIRGPMSFEDRILRDPEIRRSIEAAGGQVPAGGAEGILEAYRGTFTPGKRGRPKNAADAIRELAKPADQVAAESIAGQFDRAASADGRAISDTGSNPFVGADTSALDAAQEQYAAARMFGPEGGARGIDGGAAFNSWVRGSADRSPPARYEDLVFDEVPPRQASSRKTARPFPARTAAALAGSAAGVGLMMQDGDELTDSGNPADIGPPPASGSVMDLMPEPDPIRIPRKTFYEIDGTPFDEGVRGGLSQEDLTATVNAGPVDYSLEARKVIDRLNAMRRAAGGEVPEAPAMMKEIERLLALGNQTRRATAVAAPGDDASRLFQQAQMLIDQVNQMYRQGASPGSPEVQRIMQQVRQLQAQGDAIRNRRVS